MPSMNVFTLVVHEKIVKTFCNINLYQNVSHLDVAILTPGTLFEHNIMVLGLSANYCPIWCSSS